MRVSVCVSDYVTAWQRHFITSVCLLVYSSDLS